MNIGEKIKFLRCQSGYTQEELAISAKTTKQTIHKYETGIISNIPASKIKAIADKLNTTPAYLMGWEDDNTVVYPDNIVPMPQLNRIPLVGTIACGTPILANENLDGEVSIPDDIKADFALRCSGDSMIDARILDGDIVYIRQQPTVDNGEIAAVLIGEEATLKKVFISEGTITLLACNSNYQPFVYSGEKLNEIRILGKAVGFTSRIK